MENQRHLSMRDQYYRTFIGLPFHVGKKVLAARRVLMQSLTEERISWVKPNRYHVTLRFIGDTKVSEIEGISQALNKMVELPEKVELRLIHLGSFGPRKKPRVVWVGFEQVSLFESLKAGVDAALASCGIQAADQPFRAHLTLGRIRSLKDIDGFYRAIGAMKEDFRDQVLLNRLVYYRSELGSGGPVYTPLHELKFKDPE